MELVSARSRPALRDAVDAALATGADAEALGRDLFRVADTLDGDPSLRRVLSEPSIPADARRAIARSLLSGRVDDSAVSVVQAVVGERWVRTRDLVEAVEWCAVTTAAARADEAGQLDALEDDLFRFGRILESSPALREALSDRTAPADAKRRLVQSLLTDKVNPVTVELLSELVSGRHRSLAGGIGRYSQIAAAHRQRLIATVWVASRLSDDQRARIIRSLRAQYSRDIHLNVVVDPTVLGGVRVAVGDDVIDSTIQTRLADAARQLSR